MKKSKKSKTSKGYYFSLFLAIVAILILVGGAIYLTFYMSGKSLSSLKDGNLEDVIAINLPDTVVDATETEKTSHSMVFVGDSRTQGMENAVKANLPDDLCQFVAAEGEGLAWFQETGADELDKILSNTPDATVVLNLGVNDLPSIDSYISYYEEIFAKYPDARFYVMSVNPVSDDCQVVSNQVIDEFNQKMKAAFPDEYLDVYTYLLTGDLNTVDGLHYTEGTYLSIHYYVANRLFG